MTIDGAILIGSRDLHCPDTFQAVDPAIGATLPTAFSQTSLAEVEQACALAEVAAPLLAGLSLTDRADFIAAVAAAILAIGDDLIETAMAETGLPRLRLENERCRTAGQLRMFADELRKGEWLDATIDSAVPDRSPPRADLRRLNVALGPVAVFGASNFPLAFSVAGGDTAAAFAAGCPVVVRGHPAHPGTGELVARAVRSAVQACGLPEGAFSFLPGRAHAAGAALVADPRIKAVGFTGSRRGGLALVNIARDRPVPIPVYAEMSSINPVVLMPAALAAGAEALASGFVGSLTLGGGQFCTNPGLVVACAGPELDRFVTAAAAALAGVTPPPMLTAGIHRTYSASVAALDASSALRRVGTGAGATAKALNRCAGSLFRTEAAAFRANPMLADEVFGAAAVIVACDDLADMAALITALEGQLTATVQLNAADEQAAAGILPLLQAKAGRVLANGWPTGVEVTAAMVHGGPFPATSEGRTTSVGTLAMARFLRPVCLQDIPDSLLPPPLQAGNPWAIPRRIDGAWVLPQ